MENVSDKSCTENQNTLFIFSTVFFFEYRAVYEIMWKNIAERCRPEMKICFMGICMLDNKGYQYTLKICNTCCFSTVRVIARKFLNVTLYEMCLPCTWLRLIFVQKLKELTDTSVIFKFTGSCAENVNYHIGLLMPTNIHSCPFHRYIVWSTEINTRGSYRKSWATIFCEVTCLLLTNQIHHLNLHNFLYFST